MPQPRTYSFKDTSGGFAHPLAGVFQFAGQLGVNQFSIDMTTEQSALDVAADGTVLTSAMSGDNGQLSIEVQQTSQMHQFLLRWYNLIKTLKDAGDVTNWATAAVTLRNIVDGSQHICQGVSPSKIPTKTYAKQAGNLTWVLMCADIQNVTMGAGGSVLATLGALGA